MITLDRPVRVEHISDKVVLVSATGEWLCWRHYTTGEDLELFERIAGYVNAFGPVESCVAHPL